MEASSSVRSRHHSHTTAPPTPEIAPPSPEFLPLSDQLLPNTNNSAATIVANMEEEKPKATSQKRNFFVLFVLLVANLINYMDRYTIAGVLEEVQQFYHITNSQAGLLQTSFIISYMLLSPVFGYIGDRYNRKWPMVFGILFWSLVTLASSFVPSEHYIIFLLLRAMVGVGEASYSTIAPTIIADMFSKTLRTTALSIFYFAIPVGSGMGYIVGSQFAGFMGAWYWSLRVTPLLGIVCAFFVMVFVTEPGRGASDGVVSTSHTPFWEDVKYLLTHKSFIFSTLGFTCVTFVAGGLAFWAPLYVYRSQRLDNSLVEMEPMALYFGVITVLAGLVGVAGGFALAAKLRPITQAADPLICGFGLISGAPFLFLALLLSRNSPILTWVMIFLGETLISLNWALVTDILLYTVIPTRRSTAEALQILISHMFGDAGSPYLLGLISDTISDSYNGREDNLVLYISLQYSLYINCFVCVIGGAFFLVNSMVVKKDKDETDKYIRVQKGFKSSNNASNTSLDNAIEGEWPLKVISNHVADSPRVGGVKEGKVDELTNERSSLNEVGVLIHNESQQKLVLSENNVVG